MRSDTTAHARIDPAKLAASIVDLLEHARHDLQRASVEAGRLADSLETPGMSFPRFNTAVRSETLGLAADLDGSSASEFDLDATLRDARELRQLITLATEPVEAEGRRVASTCRPA